MSTNVEKIYSSRDYSSLHVYNEEQFPEFKKTEYDLLKINRLKRNFYWFATVASLNHALNYVVNAYSTTLLSNKLAGICLGLNWMLNSVAGLTFATPVVRLLGFKNGIIISFWGYTFQIATLAIASNYPSIAWHVGVLGAIVAGFTSAIWWTAQGVCFDITCNEISNASGSSPKSKVVIANEVRANLSAVWTVIYQSSDIVVFLTLSVIPLFWYIEISSVVLGLSMLGVATSLLGFTFDDLNDRGTQFDINALYNGVMSVPKHFSHDSRSILLAPFVFGFGITTAMFAYYLNDVAVSKSENLGSVTLGFLESFSYFIATVSAYPYAYISNKYENGRHNVIQFGSLAFLLSGVVVLIVDDVKLGTWTLILLLKGLYGLGRGVFEGSCRAVYAELFTGDDLSNAFSAQTLLVGFSGGICYFIYGILTRNAIAIITIVNGIVAMIFYFILISTDYHSSISWRELYNFILTSTCRSLRNDYSMIINVEDMTTKSPVVLRYEI